MVHFCTFVERKLGGKKKRAREKKEIMMRDPRSGLALESVSGLPPGLQSTLLRSQCNVTPIVLFCDVVTKLSEGASHRFDKERLILLTPEYLLVFAMDGQIKRRVPIQDIREVFLSMPHLLESVSHGRECLFVGSVAVEVPRQFDLAFDVSRKSADECRNVIMRFLRVVSVVHGMPALHASAPLRVGMLEPGCLGPFEGSELEHFRLKKAYAAGANPHGRKGPLMPPVLQLVTDEMESDAQQDTKLQIDCAIRDVSQELMKFRRDNADKAMTSHLTQLQSFCSRGTMVECAQQRVARRHNILLNKNTAYAVALEGIAQATASCNNEYRSIVDEMDALRAQHNAQLASVRSAVVETEETLKAIKSDESLAIADFLQNVQRSDVRRQNAERALQAISSELTFCSTNLPSLTALDDEVHMLQGAQVLLATRQQCLDELATRVESGNSLRSQLGEENAVLEKEASEAMTSCRSAKQVTTDLLNKATMLFATRNRILAEVTQCREAVLASRDTVDDIDTEIQSLSRSEAAAVKVLHVRTLEKIVSDDLRRRCSMDEGIASTRCQIADDVMTLSAAREGLLEQKLERMRRMRSKLKSQQQQ